MEPRGRGKDISFPLTLILVGSVALWLNAGHGDWTLWRVALLLIPIFILSAGVNLAVEYRRMAAAVLVSAAGAALLAQGLGLVDWSAWGVAARAWPLAVIALGVDLVLDRTSFMRLLLGVLVGVGLLAGAIVFFGERTEPIVAASSRLLTYPVEEAQAASVTLQPALASLRLGAAAESASLLDLSISPDPGSAVRETFALEEARAEVEVAYSGEIVRFWSSSLSRTPEWAAELAPGVPTDLQIEIGVGKCEIDLSGLEIRSLTLDVGLGECTVVLPSVADFEARVDGGLGQLELVLPESVEARLELDAGLTSTSLSGDLSRNEDVVLTPGYYQAEARAAITVSQGIGSVLISRR